MTHMESLMLAVCFGAVVGTTVGNLAMIIKFAFDDHKEKKRRKAESVDAWTSDN